MKSLRLLLLQRVLALLCFGYGVTGCVQAPKRTLSQELGDVMPPDATVEGAALPAGEQEAKAKPAAKGKAKAKVNKKPAAKAKAKAKAKPATPIAVCRF